MWKDWANEVKLNKNGKHKNFVIGHKKGLMENQL